MADRRRRTSRKRRPGRTLYEDDRPRGYEPTRMRRLWQDIDQSRDQLGLGRGEYTNGASSTWGDWLGWAGIVVGEAGAQIGALPQQVRTVLEDLPGAVACRTLGAGALSIAQKLPGVGTVLTLVIGQTGRNDASEP